MATDPRTLPELFAEVRRGMRCDDEFFQGLRWTGKSCGECLPRRKLTALDAIADQQQILEHSDWTWEPGATGRAVTICTCPECLALRAACRGEKP